MDESSTLITIGSLNEQKFIEKLVQKYNTLSDRVWIGLEWNDNTFKWMDGSNGSYENWDENADKNGNNKCVQMAINGVSFGKLSDDDCNRKYLTVCQKKQSSKTVFQYQLNNLTKIVEKLSLEVIPIGFLYTQLPDQSSPQQLWPSLQWTEVTQQYAGLFFRAEGSGSLPFGQTQPSNQSWISDIWSWSQNAYKENGNYELDIGLKEGEWTRFYPGSKFPNWPMFYSLRFYTTSAEVRPKNTAIKIWKRVK